MAGAGAAVVNPISEIVGQITNDIAARLLLGRVLITLRDALGGERQPNRAHYCPTHAKLEIDWDKHQTSVVMSLTGAIVANNRGLDERIPTDQLDGRLAPCVIESLALE